jgi:transcriptional antiterminator RfaH
VPQRERLALYTLGLAGFETYLPRLRERRIRQGRRVEHSPPLFPGYCFVSVVLQWHQARWAPGVAKLIMDGVAPAVVPTHVIAAIRARERGGLVELPSKLRPGDRVRVLHGPFTDHVGLYQGMRPHERIEVLLAILGSQQRVELPQGSVEPMR